MDNTLPQGLSTLEVDAVFARVKDAAVIEIPTGVGFCMAIRLEVAERIGLFDSAFGKGYREENDWCQRARILGYQHVLAPNLFVYHQHGGSFPSQERQALADRNEAILRERYPDCSSITRILSDVTLFAHCVISAPDGAGRPPDRPPWLLLIM
jgi:GT2 family glycosyltransferase